MPIKDWEQVQIVIEQIRSLPQDHCEPMWDALLPWLQKELARIVRRVVVDRHLCEDVIQEALLDVYQGIHTYDVQRSFKIWVERVAIHAAYRVLRRRGRIQKREITEPTDDAISEDEPCSLEDRHADPEDYQTLIIRRERARYLLECARSVLSDDEFLLFEAVALKESSSGREEISYEELAEILGKRADALRQQVSRMRKKVLAQAVLHPHIFTNEEIQEAVDACRQSGNPLTERELAAVQETLCGNPHRKPPSYRNTQHFRDACAKLAPYLMRHLLTLMLLSSVLTIWANSVTQSICAHYSPLENEECDDCGLRGGRYETA